MLSDKKTCNVPTNPPIVTSISKSVCPKSMFTCKSTRQCIDQSKTCDGHRDCDSGEDEDGILCNTVEALREHSTPKSPSMYIIIGAVCGVALLVVLVIVFVVHKARKRRSGQHSMHFTADTEKILRKDSDEDDGGLGIKYVPPAPRKRNSNSKNFENINFISHNFSSSPSGKQDEARMPLQMSDINDDMVFEEEDTDDSDELCNDETQLVMNV